jgi:hypothetical protein
MMDKVNTLYYGLGITTTVKTQIGRKKAARAEELGASADSVK